LSEVILVQEIPHQTQKIIKDTFADVRQSWADNGLEDEYFPTASENNEGNFFKLAGNRPVKREINSVYRLKKGAQEFIFYYEHLVSKNNLDNKIDHTRVIGKQTVPEFITQFDTEGNESKYVDSSEVKYSIPFDKEYLKKEIEPILIENHNLYVIQYDKKYGGFGFSDFLELSYDDLVKLGKYGTLNPEEIKKKPIKGRGRKIN
jgi:hypothetical protein